MPNESLPPCTCGWLEQQADEPRSPIRFDPRLHEFNIVGEGDCFWRVYHCPFCGGRAPESKREHLFAHITGDERHRLTELTCKLRNLQDVLGTLGQPDADSYWGSTTPERDRKPETTEVNRHLVYEHLSKVADVWVWVYPDNHVSVSFQGKDIGLPEERQG